MVGVEETGGYVADDLELYSSNLIDDSVIDV